MDCHLEVSHRLTETRRVQHTRFTGPVTALAFAQIDGQSVLFSGQGPNLKVLKAQGEPVVFAQAQVFRTQAIHGIIALRARAPGRLAVVIWGGPYVRVACLRWPDWSIDCSSRCRSTPRGWILAADVDDAHHSRHPSGHHHNYSPADPRVVLVTARSALLLLRVSLADGQCHLQELNASTNAILYSASIRWAARNRIVLASGTAFGDISLHLFALAEDRNSAAVDLLMHEVYSAHDGSVFGLHMANVFLVAGGREQGLLASCSDDRSIRVWDITEYMSLDVEDLPADALRKNGNDIILPAALEQQQKNKPIRRIACAWAHQSRIWGVRFVSSRPQGHGRNASINLLSFGEDASCQYWHLSRQDKPAEAFAAASGAHYSLEHQTTKVLHSGKNIWSFAVAKLESRLSLVATGGADGRISCFKLKHGSSTYHTEEDSVSTSNGTGDEASDSTVAKTEPVPVASRSKGPLVSKTFRSYKLVDANALLVATDEGSLLLGRLRNDENSLQMTLLENGAGAGRVTLNEHSIQWTEIAQLEALRPYSILATCDGCDFACISTTDHAVYFFGLAQRRLQLLEQGQCKVINILCQLSAGEA
jgi:WD40 repeat protein